MASNAYTPKYEEEGYGKKFELSKAGEAWFGLWLDRWAIYNTPLWLRLFDREKNLREPSLQDPHEFIENDGALDIPIYLPVGVEYDAVRDAVVKRIEEIERLINPAD